MKKLIASLVLLFTLSTTSHSQVIINQSIVEEPPYSVGDTIRVRYTVESNNSIAYLWFRQQYSNKHLRYVPNSTVFTQGTNVQTFFTEWLNYIFLPNPTIGVGELYNQYLSTPWDYRDNSDWNIQQFTIQKSGNSISSAILDQKYVLLDNTSYQYIHRLHIAFAENNSGVKLSPIGSQVLWLSIDSPVSGGSSTFKVRVTYPTNYDITKHNVEILPVNSNNVVDWSTNPQPIVSSPIPSNGEVSFNNLKIGDKFWIRVTPTTGQSFMDNIVTVTDAYKSFLAVSNVGLNGNETVFQYPKLERKVGNITIGDTLFNQLDSYNLFAKVMGIETSTATTIPSSTSENPLLLSGPVSTFNQGNFNSYYQITTQNSVVDMAYAWGGDLDFSHSSNPSLGVIPTSAPKGGSNVLVSTLNTNLEEVRLGISSKLENGKVVVTTSLTKSDLAGLQVVLGIDDSRIELENIIFDSGNTITNFSTVKDGRITFGSIDQLGTAKIKTGTPYKLIFKPKVTLTNTSGLFYTILSDAVDNKGNKVKLLVE
jgi:hypothetical protein